MIVNIWNNLLNSVVNARTVLMRLKHS